MNELRGFSITDADESRVIDSLALETNGIICVGEDNIDDISFSNEYIYNEDSQGYALNTAYPNQVSFTLKFKILRRGAHAANTIMDLRSFFDQSGKSFYITRNVIGFRNEFVVDSISTSHLSEDNNYIQFEFTGSYIGDFQNYRVRRKRTTFNGESPEFEFPHYFEAPEPSTIISDLIEGNMIKVINNNTGKILGLTYTFMVKDEFNKFKIENITFDERIVVNYQFLKGDKIVIDTESDEPSFIVLRNGERISLLKMVDFSVSSVPTLYSGDNRIRIDLFQDGAGVDGYNIYAEYWNRAV